MGCCGRKREQILNPPIVSLKTNPSTSGNKPSFSGVVMAPAAAYKFPIALGTKQITGTAGRTQTSRRQVSIRYRDKSPIRVRGAITGRAYEFSAVRPAQLVDDRDAAIFLRMQCFVRG
jgi:hypothetical protein